MKILRCILNKCEALEIGFKPGAKIMIEVMSKEACNKTYRMFFYQYTQSFSPKENITPEQAHALRKYCSVILPKIQHPYVSMRTDYLSNLTKNLTAQSAQLNCAELP